MRNRLKLIGLQIVLLICTSLTLMLNVSCESNAATSSAVSCEQLQNSRRLDNKENNENVSNLETEEFKTEQPLAGITLLLEDIITDEIQVVGKEDEQIKSFSIEAEYIDMWTTELVNLRSEASVNSDILLKIPKRDKVQKITSSNGWTKAIYNGTEGYIKSTYLRVTELPSLEFTDEEIDLIAKIMWLEARGESDKGLACVYIVIRNRILSSEFSDTVLEVLSDKTGKYYEFSTWKLIDTAKPDERIYEIIEEVQNGLWDGLLDEDYVYFSTKPRNNHGKVKIGSHYFCKI